MAVETLLGLAIAAAVIGLAVLVRALFPGAPAPTPGVEPVTVLRCTGEAAGLEAAVRGGEPGRRTVIFDDGLTPGAQRRAEVLALRYGASIAGEAGIARQIRSTSNADGRG